MCDKVSLPYVFFFVFRIARGRRVWVTVIFKAWFLNVSHIVFFIACEIYFFGFFQLAGWTWLRHQSGNKHRPKNGRVWKKLLKCWYTENVTQHVEKIYIYIFYRSVGFEGNIRYTKKGIQALTLQLSLSLRHKWDRSLCKFISPEATVMNVIAILRLFLVGLGLWSESFGCFFEAS